MTNGLEGLLSRASVSSLQAPVPEGELLDAILATGLRAPDHGKLRPWRYVLIRGDAVAHFADLAASRHLAREPDASQEMLERTRQKASRSPLIVALGAKIVPDHPKVPAEEQVMAVAAGVMNLLNAVHATGFGGVWITGPNAADPVIAETLGFAAPDRLLGFLFIGTPSGEAKSARRPALAEHVREWTGG